MPSRLRFNLLAVQGASEPRPRASRFTLAWPILALASALVVAPGARVEMPVRAPAEPLDPVGAQAPGRPPTAAPAAVAPAAIQRLADVLAKRYRVSGRATLDLVRTAYREANRNGLDPLLILAVVAIESSFNPIAESDAGAVGLMQIVPRFHEDKLESREAALDPRTNIEVGTQVLREYIRRAGNEIAGLQLYNGSADDPANAYAAKVIGERERLRQMIRRADGNRA